MIANQRDKMILILSTYAQFAITMKIAFNVTMAWHLHVNADDTKLLYTERFAIGSIIGNQLQHVHAMQLKFQILTYRR